MPSSLVKEALANVKKEGGIPPQATTQPPAAGSSPSDDEIRKIAEQMSVSIKIVGCGGGGCNTINRCVDEGISGAQLCAINTDAKHLLTIRAPTKILIGRNLTRGLGAGAIPDVGTRAAMENEVEIGNFLRGANIVFVTAGMGGGTGTGSAHFVADIAKRQAQALTIGVVTLPFKAEGTVRMENALAGLNRLSSICDTTIIVMNDKLLELVPKMPVEAAFKVADEVLMQTIKGLTEIITKPGLVNLDYSDILTIMNEGGMAFVGIGESDAEDERVESAVNEALHSPLLGDIDMKGSRGALVRVVGGPDMTVTEAQKAAEIVGKNVSSDARIIWGCSIEPEDEGTIKILLIFTGAKSPYVLGKGGAPSQQSKLGSSVQKQGQQKDARSRGDSDDGIDFVG
ncbi:MAG: cell division protein FtsZ [Methanomassiliicoccales archaeon]|jgi:cell division protein FtsZ